MRIGRHDIKHLAIIGVAGAAGLMATVAVFEAAEGPHIRHHPGTTSEGVLSEPVPGQTGRVRVQVIRSVPVVAATKSIRVVGSSADASPIVYVDGVRDESLEDLTPEDIAKIDVLKGPKAIERYGEEAANGVIEVTTRKGKKKGSGEGA